MKRMSAMLLVMLFLLLVGCSAVGTETDYPAAIMAEGTVYLKSVSAMPAEIDESAIIGYTTSYTDTYWRADIFTKYSPSGLVSRSLAALRITPSILHRLA